MSKNWVDEQNEAYARESYDDDTPYGRWGDHCPWCGNDWKAPHDVDCPQYQGCRYPPGCGEAAAPGRVLCQPHWDAINALLGPVNKEA